MKPADKQLELRHRMIIFCRPHSEGLTKHYENDVTWCLERIAELEKENERLRQAMKKAKNGMRWMCSGGNGREVKYFTCYRDLCDALEAKK